MGFWSSWKKRRKARKIEERRLYIKNLLDKCRQVESSLINKTVLNQKPLVELEELREMLDKSLLPKVEAASKEYLEAELAFRRSLESIRRKRESFLNQIIGAKQAELKKNNHKADEIIERCNEAMLVLKKFPAKMEALRGMGRGKIMEARNILQGTLKQINPVLNLNISGQKRTVLEKHQIYFQSRLNQLK